MAEEEVQEETKPKAEKAPAQGLSPVIILLLVINMAATGAIGYMQFDFMKKEASKPSLSELVKKEMGEKSSEDAADELYVKETVDEGQLFKLKGFTVNLAQGDGPRRFVRMTAVLKFTKQSKKEELEARKPQIRDTIISILNTKRPQDLLKREGKSYLKEEIKTAINSFLVDGQVTDMFYVGFQIN